MKRKSVLVREEEILCYVVLDLLVLSSFVLSVVELAKIEDTSLRTMGRAQRKKFQRDSTPGANLRSEQGFCHFVCWHGDMFMKHRNNPRHYLVHGWMKAIPNPVSL